jgi:uncharacterized protein YkwD
MRRVLTAAAAVFVALAIASPVARAGGFVPTDETKVQNLVNATRSAKGLGKLARNDHLVEMAREQAVRMADRGNIYHNPNLGPDIEASGLDWKKVGENVGMGPNVDLIEDAFLASPHHYENIVDPTYNAVGIGVVDGADGKRYVVQVFANVAAAAPKPAPAAPVAQPAVQQQAPQSAAPASAAPAAPAAPAEVKPASKTPAPERPSADPNAVIGGVVTPLDLRVSV